MTKHDKKNSSINKKKVSRPSRNWMVTIPNPSEKGYPLDEEYFKKLEKVEKIKYAVGQLELSNETKLLHWQLYVVLIKPQRLSCLRKLFPKSHLEVRKGSHKQAVEYCTKSDTRQAGPYSMGEEPKGQGHRSELDIIRAKIEDRITEGNFNEKELADEHFSSWCRYERSFRRYASLSRPARTEYTKGYYYYGRSGIGKSTLLRNKFPKACYMQYDGKYFSAYGGEETVIFDDCNMEHFSRAILLKLCNHIPYKLRCLGEFREFTAKTVVFIQNELPSIFYLDEAVKNRYEVIDLGNKKLFGE